MSVSFREFRRDVKFSEGWNTVCKPCIYLALWYNYLKGRIKIEKFTFKLPDFGLELSKEDFKAYILMNRFRGHHFDGYLGFSIAKELVLRRDAELGLVTMNEWRCNFPGTSGRYDGGSLPCSKYPCDRGYDWASCLDCPEREGSLPIYIEVGSITTPLKILNPFPYEVWVCDSNITHGYCYALRITDFEGVVASIGTILNTLITTNSGCYFPNYLGLKCLCNQGFRTMEHPNPSLVYEVIWVLRRELKEWLEELRQNPKHRVPSPYLFF